MDRREKNFVQNYPIFGSGSRYRYRYTRKERDKIKAKYKKQGVYLLPNKKLAEARMPAKTRNDEDKQQVLYEVNGRFNSWKEIGYCTIINEHKSA